MKNYIVIAPIAGRLNVDLLIPNVEQNSFTAYSLDRASPSKHYTDFRETLSGIKRKPNLFTLMPTSASTVDEVISLHPELLI